MSQNTRKDLWLTFSGGREAYLPNPSAQFVADLLALRGPAGRPESPLDFITRLERQCAHVLAAVSWKASPASGHALTADRLTLFEARQTLLAVLSHFEGTETPDLLSATSYGLRSPLDGKTLAELRQGLQPKFPAPLRGRIA